MPNFKRALSLVVLTSCTTSSVQSFHTPFPRKNSARRTVTRSASVSALYSDDTSNNKNILSPLPASSLGGEIRAVTVAYIDSDESVGVNSNRRKKRVVLDAKGESFTSTYSVRLPIASDANNIIGISLKEVNRGVVSEVGLQIDSMRYITVEEEVTRLKKRECTFGEDGGDSSIQVLDEKGLETSSGIVVSSVERGGLAWDLGVRAGDFVIATSATVGDKMWPKSSLEGIRSAISSRKVISSSMQVEFQRAGTFVPDAELVQEFELSLSRPMGIHIEDTHDGYVQISGFTEDVPDFVTHNLRVGDRIIAVDSTLGKMWPVSTVDGVVSSVTTRLPGQTVQLKFERVVEDGSDLRVIDSLDTKSTSTDVKDSLSKSLIGAYSKYADSDTIVDGKGSKDLLARCRGILRRYISVHDPISERSSGIPALVADRVLESISKAEIPLDPVTLSLIMNAYISCDQPNDALRTFEGTTGVKVDGSNDKIDIDVDWHQVNGGIQRNEECLNLVTATDVIRAHAKLGDSVLVKKVLSAIEDDPDTVDEGRTQVWSTNVKPDTKCYNTVLAAIVNSNNLQDAENLFEKMCEPDQHPTCPQRNIATYNTMVGAYARAGRRKDAYDLFTTMRNHGFKPDKYSVTSLIKAATQEADFDAARNLLIDMKVAGIETDVVAYNTVIKALCLKNSWFEAKELVAEMESRGINPNSKTYGLLMNGLLRLNKPGPCLTLFESACADQRTASLMENVQLYTTAITASATLGDYERAFELVSRMSFAGVKPNIKTLTALMGSCISAGKFDTAMDVYDKIPNPDGYAQTLAIRAKCGMGLFEEALNSVSISIKSGENSLSGKQLMQSYNCIIGAALEQEEFLLAKQTMDNLLSEGLIPSKKSFQRIIDSLDLAPARENLKDSGEKRNMNEDAQFEYLLGVLDALEARKLSCSAPFYSAVLAEGARSGKLKRRLASIISLARTTEQNSIQLEENENITTVAPKEVTTWLGLWKNYAGLKDRLDDIQLQTIRVNINGRELRSVLYAERAVTFGRKKRKKTAPKRELPTLN